MESKLDRQLELQSQPRIACAVPFLVSRDELTGAAGNPPSPSSFTQSRSLTLFFATVQDVAKRQATRINQSLAILTVATTFGCSYIDPYAAKWDAIKVGDSRSIAVEALGSPSVVNSVELSVLKAEQLAWRAPLGGRTYIMVTAMDRVVAKSVIN
jgi:hypothetical protein